MIRTKWLATVVAVLVVALVGTAALASGHTFNGFPVVPVFLNGKAIETDVPGIILEGRTLLPVRAITEALGLSVQWDQETRTVFLEDGTGDEADEPKGSSLTINAVSAEPIQKGDEVFVAVMADATVQNNGMSELDLSQVEIFLSQEDGTRVMGKLALADDQSGILAPGEKAMVTVEFPEVQVKNGESTSLRIENEGGDVVQAISVDIELSCSWPPIRCKLRVKFSF